MLTANPCHFTNALAKKDHLSQPESSNVVVLQSAHADKKPFSRCGTAGEGLDKGNAAEAAQQQAQLAGCEGCQAVCQPQHKGATYSIARLWVWINRNSMLWTPEHTHCTATNAQTQLTLQRAKQHVNHT